MTDDKIYAGFWVRFFAGILDLVFLAPIIILAFFFLSDSSYETVKMGDTFKSYFIGATASGEDLHVIDFITYFVSVIYIVYFLAGEKQATIGKRIMGIYVGTISGSKLSKPRAAMRAFASMITATTLGLGFIIVIFTKEKIALHDFLCNTRVFFGKK